LKKTKRKKKASDLKQTCFFLYNVGMQKRKNTIHVRVYKRDEL
jgi:hypothetical protein